MTKIRASLHTLGCRLNQAETSILAEGVRRKGFHLVEFGQPTDLLILNTCSVTEDAERTSQYLIRKTLKHSPSAFVAVTGCYAQTGVDKLRLQAGIDLIVGNQFKLDLPTYLPSARELQKRPSPEVHYTRKISRGDFHLSCFGEPDSTRALLKIQDGCNARCRFCIIPSARGQERSRTLEDVLREAHSLTARGYREVVLTGVNIGRYFHNGRDFCELLRRLDQETEIERIRISSIEPTTVGDELIEILAGSTKLCPYLHVPLQSGDDQTLQAMNRHYTVRSYVTLIERMLTKIPNIGLGTDLMVGFPGETGPAFLNTVAIATALPFSYLHVFPYSPRPGTAATRMGNPLQPAIVRKRAEILRDLNHAKRLAFNKKQIGTTVSALFETGPKGVYCLGTTPNFIKVAVTASNDFQNQIRSVTVTAATDRWVFGHIASHEPATTSGPLL